MNSNSPKWEAMSSMSPAARWRRVLLLTMVPMFVALGYYAYETAFFSTYVVPPPSRPHELALNQTSLDFLQSLHQLYAPLIHPITARDFVDDEGTVWSLPAGEPRFTKPLGKKVCILDVDTRPLSDKGQLFSTEPITWSNIGHLTSGVLSHYLYALIHGYTYKYVRAPAYADRWNTWVKVPMIKQALQSHDLVVFLDTDAHFHHTTLPLEWLLNYWQITPNTLVAMAVDPDAPWNLDGQGRILLNTGFVIAQQSERTQELMQAWGECPNETRYPGCAQWKTEVFHEQRAFGEYLRDDFNRTDDVRVLPCAEANGSPYAPERTGCVGHFVRHYWNEKVKGPRETLVNAVMGAFVPGLHGLFGEMATASRPGVGGSGMEGEREGVVQDERGRRLEGAEVLRKRDGEEIRMYGEGRVVEV